MMNKESKEYESKFTFQKLDVVEDENLIPDFNVKYFKSNIIKLLAENLQRLRLEVIRAYKVPHVAHVLGILVHAGKVQIDVKDGVGDEES